MEDQGILELFFARSEQAIAETDRKYGGYCYSIAYNILSSTEDSEEGSEDAAGAEEDEPAGPSPQPGRERSSSAVRSAESSFFMETSFMNGKVDGR